MIVNFGVIKEIINVRIPTDRCFDAQWNPPGYPNLTVRGLRPVFTEPDKELIGFDGNYI